MCYELITGSLRVCREFVHHLLCGVVRVIIEKFCHVSVCRIVFTYVLIIYRVF